MADEPQSAQDAGEPAAAATAILSRLVLALENYDEESATYLAAVHEAKSFLDKQKSPGRPSEATTTA